MAKSEDSRPFMVLKQNAEDFQDGFAVDIKSCLNVLHSKITTLIRDPDCDSPSKDAKRLSAHLEFSKAKYEVFMETKSLIETMQESWKDQLDEMKSSFLENVEILLASMKLPLPEEEKSSTKSKDIKKSCYSSSPSVSSSTSYRLLDTAKKIPVLNSLLPKAVNKKTYEVVHNSIRDNSGRFRKVAQSQTPTLLCESIAVSLESDDNQDSDDEDETEVIPKPPVNTRQPRKTFTPKTLAAKEKTVPTKSVTMTKEKKSEEPVMATPLRKNVTRGRKSILKPESSNESELHATPSRSTRKRTAVKEISVANIVTEPNVENRDIEMIDATKSPKNVHFSVGLDVHDEDLEIYSPDVNISRGAPKRKTVVAKNLDSFSDINLTPNAGRFKSKRKTIGGSAMDVSAAPSPKRLKRGGRNNVTSTITEESDESDLLDGDESAGAEHYTPWLLLEDLDGKTPAQPGVYELKVYKAKKSAYIGSCDNLRQKLTLHKIGQNSGHKHLDKFLERNRKDVQVRFEKFNSAVLAKKEELNRIKAFVGQHKTTPAYN